VLLAGCAIIPPPTPLTTTAELRDARGQVVGTASLAEVPGALKIVLEVRGLPPGDRAVHVHERGRCDPPDFASAGAHFDPENRRHGVLAPDGPHAGDLPTIAGGPDGTGRMETTTSRMTLGPGPTSVLDEDGSTILVHARSDDHQTDPDGGSGPAIACGVILRP
jgi:Cu-Zn family superoxide dismutase